MHDFSGQGFTVLPFPNAYFRKIKSCVDEATERLHACTLLYLLRLTYFVLQIEEEQKIYLLTSMMSSSSTGLL